MDPYGFGIHSFNFMGFSNHFWVGIIQESSHPTGGWCEGFVGLGSKRGVGVTT